jgi:hypothetical protein
MKMEKNSATLGTSSSYVASTLARISMFFVVNYTPNTPVGGLDVNISKLIKLKGNLAFPENQVTLGGYHGGHPPPPKEWSHFFAKTRKFANYAST